MMKHYLLLLLFVTSSLGLAFGQDIHFEEVELKNVDGEMVRVQDLAKEKGLIVVFTGIHCVYAKKYEDRLSKLSQQYQDSEEIGFVLVNSNDPEMSHEEDFEHMVAHAAEQEYAIPFLADPQHELADSLKARKNPEAFVLQRDSESGNLSVFFHGAIDDNPLLESRVKKHLLSSAIEDLLAGKEAPDYKGVVKGCSIKRMQ